MYVGGNGARSAFHGWGKSKAYAMSFTNGLSD
jgi:hypothetical protein